MARPAEYSFHCPALKTYRAESSGCQVGVMGMGVNWYDGSTSATEDSGVAGGGSSTSSVGAEHAASISGMRITAEARGIHDHRRAA
jgi:hypothetical protein